MLRVDDVSFSVEGLVAISVRIVSAARLITDTAATTGGARALIQTCDMAGMRSELRRHFIGLPDIHFVAAGAVVVDIGYAIDPGGFRALSIAVAGTVSRTSRVQSRATTSSGHLGQVECAIHATGKVADIHGKGELLIEKLQEVIVLASWSQKVHTRRDACLSTVDVQVLMESHGVSVDHNAMLGVVADALDSTILGTSLSIGADGLVGEAR